VLKGFCGPQQTRSGPRKPRTHIRAEVLGVFMMSACLCTAVLEYPGSALHLALRNASLRRFLLGLGMGLTATSIVYSPWGRWMAPFIRAS
jgi:aquaporin Z